MKLLNSTIQSIELHLSTGIGIAVWSPTQDRIELVFEKDQCELAKVVMYNALGHLKTRSFWEKTGFGLRDWIEHVMEIFNHSAIDMFRIVGSRHAESYLKRIHKTTDGLEVGTMEFVYWTEERVHFMRRTFQPTDVSLTFPDEENFTPKSTQRILLENQHFLMYRWADSEPRFTLNDLLAINCSQLFIPESTLTAKDLNIFLKHWIIGFIGNLNMVQLKKHDGRMWSFEAVLNDIDYTISAELAEDIQTVVIPRYRLSELFLTYTTPPNMGSILTIYRCG